MNGEALIGLINNAALLLALGILYDLLPLKPQSNTRVMATLTGAILGLIGIAVMINPWRFGPGVIFDTRSILLSIAGLFFGFIPTLIAVTMTGLFRLYQAGAGTWMGLAVILTSAGIGLAWRYLRPRWFKAFGWLELYGFGLVVHIAMLLWVFILPQAMVTTVFNRIALPVMVIYPVGTVLLGKLLAHQQARREAEQVVRAQEERYRLLFENSGEAILLCQPDGKIYAANPAACRIFGRSEAEICALGRGGLVDLHDSRLQSVLETRRRTGKFKGELNFVRQDGVIFPGELSTTLFRDAEGTEKTSMFIRDITERKQAEESIRAKDILLHEMSRMAQIGGWEFDATTLQGTWTEEIARIHDLNPEESTNVELGLSFYQSESREKIELAIQEAIELGRPYDLELELVTAKGNHKWVRTVGHPIKQGDRVVKVRGTFQDITERKRAEEALRESDEVQRAIISASPLAIISLSPGGTVLTWNEAAEEMFGWTRNEVLGKFLPIVPKDKENEFAELRQRVLNGNAFSGIELRRIRKDGSLIEVSISTAPIRNGEGKITAIMAVIADITERKQAQEEIRKLNAELEQRVAQRTAQLEAINRELETFTYSVSHDLKAPLRGIDGYSRLLLADYADKLDEEGRTFLHTIRQATQQMNELIEDLLAYSRLERRSLQRRPVDLQALIESLLREYADEIKAGGVAVTTSVACANITADPDGLAMALRNLLDNALKFTWNIAAPAIEIGGRETETSCIIWVRDNGIGFDMKFHDRIFDIFQRLHRVEEYPGTGIGLAIVHKAVARLGGRVWAESEPGRGAVFYIEIPHHSDPKSPIDL